MIVTVASFKGGVGKTVTAVHLAAYLSGEASTVLIDGDPNRGASGWGKRGELPFEVVDEKQAVRFARDYDHIVIDTAARPEPEELQTLAGGCDLLLMPTTPDALSLEALMLTVGALRDLGKEKGYAILLTMVPPRPSRDGEQAAAELRGQGLPVLEAQVGRLVAFQKAALAGVPVYEVKDARADIGWREYARAGKEVMGW